MDCFEKGILNPSDTDGLNLRWGNTEAVCSLLKKIALRKGFGDLLAEGSLRASQKIGKGSEALSFHLKGQDLIEPMRSCKGWALGVAVSPRGGTHTRGAPQTEFRAVDPETGKRIWGVETAGNPRAYEGKAKLVVYYERFHAVLDSLGLCHFITNWSSPDLLGPEDVARLSSLALGEQITQKELMCRGEKILTLEKIYNLLHTEFGRQDDFPPALFMQKGIKTGPFKGEKLEKEKWDEMLSEYYTLHGWDPITSFPQAQTLMDLGLKRYSDKLSKANKLMR
jgi:aldehyde:ferredoxin oxidoreductase